MLSVENLKYRYRGSKDYTIKGINFDINPGEILGFLGPSGSGKTTTQRVLIGLLKGYEGNVNIFGKERKSWGREFYERIGVAFDFPNLYTKLTAEENLKLIGSYYKNCPADIDGLLDMVNLLPDKNKRVESFSKGMKMRLNFVRSIMHNPELMFFDEPTSGLDPVNAKIIKDIILKQKSQGKTVFLTTHNMTVAHQLCDRVAFLIDGKIPICDSPANLKVKYGKRTVKVEYLEGENSRIGEFSMERLGSEEGLYEILKTRTVKTIHSQDASLEDIFIKVTGRELL